MRLLPLLLLALQPIRADAAGVVRIEADVAVEGAAITLGEIATLDGLTPEEEAKVAAFKLGDAARPARVRTFSGTWLEKELARVAPGLMVDIPDVIRVHTAHRELRPEYLRERLEAAIRHRMPWPESAIELSQWRLPETFAAPVAAHRLLVRFKPNEDFLGRVSAGFELIDPDDPQVRPVRRSASVEVKVELPVVVLSRRVRRGQPLDEDAVRLETRDLRRLPDGVVTDLNDVLGGRAGRNLQAGMTLLFSAMQSPQLVRRGDMLIIDASRAGLFIRAEGRALESGKLGQVIRIENVGSRRRFAARITAPGRAELALAEVGFNR